MSLPEAVALFDATASLIDDAAARRPVLARPAPSGTERRS